MARRYVRHFAIAAASSPLIAAAVAGAKPHASQRYRRSRASCTTLAFYEHFTHKMRQIKSTAVGTFLHSSFCLCTPKDSAPIFNPAIPSCQDYILNSRCYV